MSALAGLRRGSVLLAVGMFLILAVMMVPVPTGMLDLMLTFNLQHFSRLQEKGGPRLLAPPDPPSLTPAASPHRTHDKKLGKGEQGPSGTDSNG